MSTNDLFADADFLGDQFEGFEDQAVAVAIKGTDAPFGRCAVAQYPGILIGKIALCTGFVFVRSDVAIAPNGDADILRSDGALVCLGDPVEQFVLTQSTIKIGFLDGDTRRFATSLSEGREMRSLGVAIFDHFHFCGKTIDTAATGKTFVAKAHLK